MNDAAKMLLTPLSGLYGALARARARAYAKGWLASQSVDAPVFSVGNLTTGGTGKTPLVAWLAQFLADEGRRVCVLTRGYGRENPRARVLVSDGKNVLADALTGGDEPLWLAEKLPGAAAVVADADRVAAARWAMRELKSDCFVLDDGFQHLRLRRDFDLVAVDAANPWGGGYALPAGHLREPLTALQRADAIVLTRVEQSTDLSALAAQIVEIGGGKPVFAARTKVTGLREAWGKPGFAPSAETRWLAFCALGHPAAFFRLAESAGYRLARVKAFRDHYSYRPTDLTELLKQARENKAEALLTTAKDAVKLRGMAGELPLYVMDIEPEIEKADELKALIRETIQRKNVN
jgi:tetraacyldisaccharide 4'-kinase